MLAAVVAFIAVPYAAGYSRFDRPLRELFRPFEWPVRPSPHLKFIKEHSVWTVFLPLFVVLGVGWGLRHYG
jgi:hypothetical protein